MQDQWMNHVVADRQRMLIGEARAAALARPARDSRARRRHRLALLASVRFRARPVTRPAPI
jgi:hypothetical protein